MNIYVSYTLSLFKNTIIESYKFSIIVFPLKHNQLQFFLTHFQSYDIHNFIISYNKPLKKYLVERIVYLNCITLL